MLCRSFAFWGRTHYVRNLVMRRDGLYEVLVRAGGRKRGGARACVLRAAGGLTLLGPG